MGGRVHTPSRVAPPVGRHQLPQGSSTYSLNQPDPFTEGFIEVSVPSQGRLGPGRLHHCMRVVGMAERAMELMRHRMHTRSAFGGPLSQKEVLQHKLAECRISLEQARLMVLNAAHQLDTHGNKVRGLSWGSDGLKRVTTPWPPPSPSPPSQRLCCLGFGADGTNRTHEFFPA